MFPSLAGGLDDTEQALRAGCPSTDEVVELARLRARFESIEAEALARWDAERVWADTGAKSGAALLAHRTRHANVECASKLALGRALRKLPAAADAFARGEISAQHVRVLARARNERTEACWAEGEPLLVEHAKALSFRHFTRTVAYWTHHADPDGTTKEALDRRDRRHLTVSETPDGAVVSGFLDAVGTDTVRGELERLASKLFDEDRAEAEARLGRDALAHELARTRAQRWADALVEMANRSITADGAKARPLFTVVIGEDTVGDLCELQSSGRVIPPGALAPWIDQAQLEAILFEQGGRDVRVSRKRSFVGAVRRILEVRDRECFHETCEDPPERCQGDHIERYADGGLTWHGNGQLACGFHNRHREPPRAA